ncbi:MAG: hypothetical protein KKG69_14600 [Alphaproteobacteria bacterium]|nr:hypothetical protein [Alphaproteobacteria bacterium]MBU2232499.1 hypothetical protein [Alphaproteobacteria bacterium]
MMTVTDTLLSNTVDKRVFNLVKGLAFVVVQFHYGNNERGISWGYRLANLAGLQF